MMRGKKEHTFLICLLLIFILTPVLSAVPRTIVFLPLQNEGNYRYDKLITYIPNFLYESVKEIHEMAFILNRFRITYRA